MKMNHQWWAAALASMPGPTLMHGMRTCYRGVPIVVLLDDSSSNWHTDTDTEDDDDIVEISGTVVTMTKRSTDPTSNYDGRRISYKNAVWPQPIESEDESFDGTAFYHVHVRKARQINEECFAAIRTMFEGAP